MGTDYAGFFAGQVVTCLVALAWIAGFFAVCLFIWWAWAHLVQKTTLAASLERKQGKPLGKPQYLPGDDRYSTTPDGTVWASSVPRGGRS
jgi:hypothetical protein